MLYISPISFNGMSTPTSQTVQTTTPSENILNAPTSTNPNAPVPTVTNNDLKQLAEARGFDICDIAKRPNITNHDINSYNSDDQPYLSKQYGIDIFRKLRSLRTSTIPAIATQAIPNTIYFPKFANIHLGDPVGVADPNTVPDPENIQNVQPLTLYYTQTRFVSCRKIFLFVSRGFLDLEFGNLPGVNNRDRKSVV